jgi:predicted GIY-YIG superfamily endonuclease
VTYLYRAFDATNALLYVGISEDMRSRFERHKYAEWAEDIDTVTAEMYATRQEARAAELLAIKTEKPKWNVADSPDREAVEDEKRRRSRRARAGAPTCVGSAEADRLALEWYVRTRRREAQVTEAMFGAVDLYTAKEVARRVLEHVSDRTPELGEGVLEDAVIDSVLDALAEGWYDPARVTRQRN